MLIKHPIGDFLVDLFPRLDGKINDLELVIQLLANYPIHGPFKQKFAFKDGCVIDEIDTLAIAFRNADDRKVIAFFESVNTTTPDQFFSYS